MIDSSNVCKNTEALWWGEELPVVGVGDLDLACRLMFPLLEGDLKGLLLDHERLDDDDDSQSFFFKW